METVTDGRGIKTVYVYDNRDRVTQVSSTNATVTYSYDGCPRRRQLLGGEYRLERGPVPPVGNGDRAHLLRAP